MFLSPARVLIVVTALCAALLLLPVTLPIGANYWDLFLHVDGAYRVSLGQVPHVDFFTPAGALPFYALAGVRYVFPDAHPLLAGQYAFGIAALLLIVIVLRGHKVLALAVLVPVAVFVLLPFNAISFFPAPGVDAIGLYNRQAGFLLTALVTALVFGRQDLCRDLVIAVALAALLFTKFNGFAGGILCLGVATVSGAMRMRSWLIVTVIIASLVGVLQIYNGLPLAYLADLRAMMQHNSGHAFARLATQLSVKIDVILPLLLLIGLLFWQDRPWRDRPWQNRTWQAGSIGLIQSPAAQLAGYSLAMVLYESQNTGSQEYLALWPVLLLLLRNALVRPQSGMRFATLGLIAAVCLPTAVAVVQAAMRAGVGAFTYVSVPDRLLDRLGRVSAKAEYQTRAAAMLTQYRDFRGSYDALAEAHEVPGTLLYSTPDYQLLYLADIRSAIDLVAANEVATGRVYKQLYTLDYVDVIPFLTGRTPVRGVTVSFDPGRGYPLSEHARMNEALQGVDGILVPHCPETPARKAIAFAALPSLTSREKISLSPCWDLYRTSSP